MNKLFCGDCSKVMVNQEFTNLTDGREIIIVTDPPFNVRYHYASYSDNMPEDTYLTWLVSLFKSRKSVVIHYPEMLHKLSIALSEPPMKVVSWVYNSNTAKQHRDIAFYGVMPNFNKVKQPYKNLNDKRIKKLIEQGKQGARLYDWWNVNQVKNVSREKSNHPCQMPLQIMKNIVGILPTTENTIIVDPFMGSGTTGVACSELGIDFIGIELDDMYFSIAKQRISNKENRHE